MKRERLWKVLWYWHPRGWNMRCRWYPRAEPAHEHIFKWWQIGPLRLMRFVSHDKAAAAWERFRKGGEKP